MDMMMNLLPAQLDPNFINFAPSWSEAMWSLWEFVNRMIRPEDSDYILIRLDNPPCPED